MSNLGAIGNALQTGQIQQPQGVQSPQQAAQDPRVQALVQQGYPLEFAIQMVYGDQARKKQARATGIGALQSLGQSPDAREEFRVMQNTLG